MYCLYEEYHNTSLSTQITQYLDTSVNLPQFPVNSAVFGIYIDEQIFTQYSNSLLVYQGNKSTL